jgi:hypothetical protein
VSGTLDFSTLLFPEYSLNAHFFVNGALSVNSKSNSVLDMTPSAAGVLSAGAGLTFMHGPAKVQLNVQQPYYVTKGLKFLKFQIGISAV